MNSLMRYLFEFRRSEYYIFLTPDERSGAVQQFRVLLQVLQRYQGPTMLIARAIAIWIFVLLALYIVLAYRPDFAGSVDTAKSVASTNSGKSVFELNRKQVSSFTAFTEYLARVTGTIPQECAIAGADMKLPVKMIESSDISLPGMAYMLPLVGLGPEDEDFIEQGNEQFYLACQWRSSPASLVAFISLDVGLVQKITLLFLIIGWLWLRRSRLQFEIDRAAFPIDDPRLQPDSLPRLREQWSDRLLGLTPNQIDQEDLDRGEHPITIIEREDWLREAQRFPLYPVTYLGLDKDSDQNSQVRQYRTCVEDIRRSMGHSGQTEPFDLILDVLERGGSTGLVGEAGDRLRVGVFEYGEKLAARLWPAEYILWLLPTIGFLGTIYGISTSLVRAKNLFSDQDQNPEKFAEDIQLVVDGLGVAFDTTSLALVCATVLYLSLCSVRERISDLTERARETLQKLLVRRMVDRDAIPKRQLPEDLGDGPAPLPDEGADNGPGEARG